MAMTPRERVLCALNHEEPDRVPIFFGTTGATTMLVPGYARFADYLGVRSAPRLLSRTMQYARLDEEVMLRYGVDGRPLLPGPAPSTLRQEIDQHTLVDEWGTTWRMKPGTLYYEIADCPLRRATLSDLAPYPWPDLAHASRFAGLAAEADAVRRQGFAVVALSGVNPIEQIWGLRGLDTWLVDLVENLEFARALLGLVTDLMLAGVEALLGRSGASTLTCWSWPTTRPASMGR